MYHVSLIDIKLILFIILRTDWAESNSFILECVQMQIQLIERII